MTTMHKKNKQTNKGKKKSMSAKSRPAAGTTAEVCVFGEALPARLLYCCDDVCCCLN